MKSQPESPVVTIQIPVHLPTAERMEEIYREETRAVIAERHTWLNLTEAAAYLRMSRRSLDRKRREWGLPVSDLGGIQIVLRRDLDAIVTARLTVTGAGSVIDFPSQQSKATQRAA